jgi:hypothetical protein
VSGTVANEEQRAFIDVLEHALSLERTLSIDGALDEGDEYETARSLLDPLLASAPAFDPAVFVVAHALVHMLCYARPADEPIEILDELRSQFPEDVP